MMFEIVIHIFPNEIDNLNQTLISLKRSSLYLSYNDKIKISVMLNINLVDWENSIISKDYFISRFKDMEILTKSWAETNFFYNNSNILGNFSFHREVYKNTESNFIITLDTDVIYSETLLANLINSAKLVTQSEKYFIITPEIYKLWDNSWDVIVNKKYKDLLPSQNYVTEDPYIDVVYNQEPILDKIDNFKFAMGWFTLINKDLLRLIELPKSMGHYGPDDTFIMMCAGILRNKGINVNQFVLRNEIIRENVKYKSNLYNNFIKNIDKKNEFREIAQNNFNKEIQNFINKKL
jgi:hypothetical protein